VAALRDDDLYADALKREAEMKAELQKFVVKHRKNGEKTAKARRAAMGLPE
jgi:hypothetical protein